MKVFCGTSLLIILLISTFVGATRNKRDDADSYSAQTFADLFNDFLAGLFGSGNDDSAIDAAGNTTSNGTGVEQDMFNDVSETLTSSDNTTNDASTQVQPPPPPPPSPSTKTSTATSAVPEEEPAPTESNQTSTSSTGTVTTTASWLTSFLDESYCYNEAVLQNFCPIPEDMMDVSFWDLYSVQFSDTVLDALMIGCTKGSWCLQDRFDYWAALIVERVDMVMNSEISTSMCLPETQACVKIALENYRDCSIYPQMDYAVDSLKLICDLKQNEALSEECYKHVLTALHVTLADIMRDRNGSGFESVSDDVCKQPEAHMTKGLICVTNACPSEVTSFQSFAPWAWFTAVVDDLIDECDLDPTKCIALLTPTGGLVYESEVGTMIGISVATMVTAIVLAITVCVCYKRHRRNIIIKDGYEKLLNEGDES